MKGRLQHGIGLPSFYHLPRVHHEHLIGDVPRTGNIVRDVEERNVLSPLQIEHQIQDSHANRDVQHGDRLVRQQDIRLDGERSSNTHPLPLSTGQLMGIFAGIFVSRHQSHGGEELSHALRHFAPGHDLMQEQWTSQMVPDPFHGVQ